MQVYGAQSRIRKYTSLPRRAAVDHKFSQIVGRLDDLTKQVWALSAGDSPDPAGIAVARQALGTRCIPAAHMTSDRPTARQSRHLQHRQSCPKLSCASFCNTCSSMVPPALTGILKRGAGLGWYRVIHFGGGGTGQGGPWYRVVQGGIG